MSERGVTRRRALLAGGGALGLAAAGAAGALTGCGDDDGGSGDDVVAFTGAHQAGVATPAQARLVFGTFDLASDRKEDLQQLLQTWTRDARLMTVGKPTGALDTHPEVPAGDSGEALGLPPARLSITFGLGPGVFSHGGEDRLGLGSRRPSLLHPLPALPNEQLDPARTGGDICVQACADDPQVAFHAVRNLQRSGQGLVRLRWLQLGFGSNTRTTRSTAQATPRNLMGFKDGTRNLDVKDAAAMRRFVWVGDEEPQRWFRGGTYLVARRIRMLIESWDRDRLGDQEAVIGRRKTSGAPLTGDAEFDTPDFRAKGAAGPVIPADAHIRLASPESNGGTHILRRGYAYTDGTDPSTGLLDAGLFFVAFQKDPARQFIALQRRLGSDALNEYIQHTGGGLFAVLPGVGRSGYVGQALFA